MRRIVLIVSLLCGLFLTKSSFAKDDSELIASSAKVKELIQKYTTRLFPHHDPFARVFSVNAGRVLFDRMNVRVVNRIESPSPLSKVNYALKNFITTETTLDIALVRWMMSDAEAILAKKMTPQMDLQSNLLALHFLSQYLQRFEPVEKSEQLGDDTNKKGNENDQKKDKKKQSPKYPDMPENYKPTTKDTKKDKEKGSKEDPSIVSEVNFETPYFGNRFYAEIVRGAPYPFKEISLPGISPNPPSGKDSQIQMIVHPYGKKNIRLFLPPFYRPLQSSDPRVHVVNNGKGSYDVKLDAELEDITIPLSNSVIETVSVPILEIYKRPVGFKLNEWPSSIQTGIFQKFRPEQSHTQNAVKLAQTIAAHIASQYLYSVGERPETDPIKALETGAFQCDMAAYAMVGLLRDVYKIPSRVVGGFRAKKHKKGGRHSYLVMPGEGHAWVEIYDNGRWIPFDPTPMKKDKKEDENKDGEKDEYSDRELPNPELDSQEEKTKDEISQPGDGSAKDQGDGESNSKEDQLQEDTQRRIKDIEEDKKNGTAEGDGQGDSKNVMDLDELASLLELGSLELDPKPDSNPLRERAMRVLLRLILDPNNKGSDTLDLLNKAKSVFRSVRDTKVQELYNEALQIHENEHDNLASWIRYVALMLNTRDLTATYKDVYKAKKATELFAKTLDDDSDRIVAASIIQSLNKVLSEIYSFAHVDSEEISKVLAFYQSLPSLVQTYLHRRYDLKTVGPNAPTKEITRLMKEGKLNDLRLLASLYPVTDFIMNATPRPEFEEIHAWQRDLRKPSGRDLLPLQRFSELARALLLQPGLSLEENIRDNTAFVMTRRQRLRYPTGRGIEDSEKITIVLYDISGSMTGDPAHFQAGLISAFTARALSEISASGHHRHRVLLIPFDDKPGEPTRVTNTEEALDVIHNYSSKLAKSGGGTDIQKAMMQALALIADAEKYAGEPLAAANIVLMTDGQADVNLEELSKARNAINRSTPVQALFLAIGTTNNDLVKFAMDSRSIGFENGFYSEFSTELMSQYLAESTSSDLKIDKSTLYTEHTSASPSRNVLKCLDEASRFALILSEHAKTLNKVNRTPAQHYREFETIPWKNQQRERALAQHLERLRMFTKSLIFKKRYLLDKVIDDIMTNFEKITHVPLSETDDIEQEQLRHLLRSAAGMES